MEQSYIILATPRIARLLETQFTVFEKTAAQLSQFLTHGLPAAAFGWDTYHFCIQSEPPLSVIFLTGIDDTSPSFLILSGAGDGLGPTHLDIPCKAKGIFPTVGQVHAGRWEPLERIHII